MVPYRGRQALRLARLALAVSSIAWHFLHGGVHFTWPSVVMLVYTAYSVGALLELKYDTRIRAAIGASADAAFLAMWCWLDPFLWATVIAVGVLVAPPAILLDAMLTVITSLVAIFIVFSVPSQNNPTLVWS